MTTPIACQNLPHNMAMGIPEGTPIDDVAAIILIIIQKRKN
jgi:hypothetical protein